MTPRYKERRGRHKGISNQDHDNLYSIVLIARKHDIDPRQLVAGFIEAFNNRISHCGSLTITCRTLNQESAAFLITQGDQVVWQFPLKQDSLSNPLFRDSIKEIPIPEKIKDDEDKNRTIDELRSGMKGVTLTAKITEIPPAKNIVSRWGTPCLVSNVKIVDETGSIRLSLWNNQIGSVNIGDHIKIENGYVGNFLNQPQVRLSRSGTLTVTN